MSFLLDTNILSAHLKRPSGLIHRFTQHSGRLYTSTIALAELYVWAENKGNPAPTVASIQQLMKYEVSVIPYDDDCARKFGQIRVALRRQGRDAPSLDLLIASVALAHNLTLVTHNTVDFQNIPNLRLEDWLTP